MAKKTDDRLAETQYLAPLQGNDYDLIFARKTYFEEGAAGLALGGL